MEKRRRPIVDYLIYLVVRSAVCVLQAVPTAWIPAVAEVFARLGHTLDKRHRRVAAENIRLAFPELANRPGQVDRLVYGCYLHFATMLLDIVRLPRKIRYDSWRSMGSIVNGRPILRGMLSDRPLLIVTAHFGNWELAGYGLGAFGYSTYAIARVLDNPYLERFFKQFRQKTGQTIIAKKDDFDRLSAVMKAGGKVATLGDQDAGPRGVFVNFFGRPASAHKAVALMAIEYDAPMVIVGVPRVRPRAGKHPEIGPYEVVCEATIDPRDFAQRPDAVKAITQAYHDALERLIRRHPEQYFWLHRRWKTQPVARKKAETTRSNVA